MGSIIDLIQDFPVSFGVLVYWVATLATTYQVVRRSVDPRGSLLWLFVVWSFPFVGLLIYFVFGVNRAESISLRRKKAETVLQDVWTRARPEPQRLTGALFEFNSILDQYCDSELRGDNTLKLYDDAPAAIDIMLGAIGGARETINIYSYIIGTDTIGRRLMGALLERAKAGVEVRIMYDGYGSLRGRMTGFFRRYKHPNLQHSFFTTAMPRRGRLQANIRNHRKLLIIDGRTAFTGGINFYDTYLSGTIDFHFRIEGSCVSDLQYTFLRDWYYMTSESADKLMSEKFFPVIHGRGQQLVRVQNGAPTPIGYAATGDTFFGLLSVAKKQVLVITPYFVPTPELACALRVANMRGVNVRILVPHENNHVSIFYAARANYAKLLESGVEIFERRAPFIHAKAMLVDDEIAIIGSANLDSRSLNLNFETNLVVMDGNFASDMKIAMLQEFAHADAIQFNEWERRPLRQRLLENLFNLLHPAI